MKMIRIWGIPLLATLLLAACGGGDGGQGAEPAASTSTAAAAAQGRPFRAVISFGDSLSDAGTYTPATAIPGTNPPLFLGGKFTTNTATSTIWVENLATQLGLVVTPAEVGFAGRSVRCPAAAQGLASTCTAYGQGGARVGDANGTNHDAGALTVPVRTQIANHLASFGRFNSSDLILVWAGANDLLWHTEQDPNKNPDSFVVRLFTILAMQDAHAITPAEAQVAIGQALAASQAAMRSVALELSGYVRRQIVAKGGKHVVVLTLPDPAVTPEGVATTAFSPLLGAALTALADAYNQGLKDGLAGSSVPLIDMRSFISDVVAHPTAHGITNAAVPACDAVRIAAITGDQVKDGSSLFCNATPGAPFNGLRAGADIDTWFFADLNHPTVGGHRLISDEVMRHLKAFGWLKGGDRSDEI